MIEQQATEHVDPSWLQLLERLGLPIFLILFGCAIIWKLLPYVIEWFKQGTISARIVAEAVPDMKDSLQKMAGMGSTSQAKLDRIDERTVAIEQKADQLIRMIGDHKT